MISRPPSSNHHIIFVHPFFGNGGAEKSLLALSSALYANGYKVSIICIDCAYPHVDDYKHIVFYQANAKKSLFLGRLILKVVHACAIYDCAIVLNQAFTIAALAIILRANICLLPNEANVRIIAFERLSPNSFFGNSIFRQARKFLYNISLTVCDAILTNSIEQKAIFGYSHNESKVYYIPNCCSTDHIARSHAKKSLHRAQGSFKNKILWLGRLEAVKRPLIAIEALKYLGHSWSLTIHGCGSLLDECIELARSLKLDDRIVFSSDSKIDFWDYTCLLHTSLWEGMPNAILESLACDLPVVSTFFQTGLHELFIPFWIYPSNSDPFQLSRNIELLSSNFHSHQRMQSPISSLIKNYYTASAMYSAFADAINLQSPK